MEGKKIWIATIGDTEQKVVVKFTQQYATDVHQACAGKGIAPLLLYADPVGYGWTMVIMEYLEGYNTLYSRRNQLSEDLRKSVHEKLKILHDMGFVHGDMRFLNILLGPGGEVKFVDFEWAGKIRDVKYPSMKLSVN